MNTTMRNIFITNEGEPQIQTLQDLMRGGGSMGKRLLAANFDTRVLRTNDLLRKDEWKQLDDALVPIAAVRLRPLELLRSRGLVKTLDGLGVLLSQYETISDMTEAEVGMSGLARTQEDSSDFTLKSVPIPIISKDFRVNLRRLLASRRNGEGIDVTQVQQATRKVSEKMVDLLFKGYSGNLDGNTLKGLTNHANVNTVTGADWGTVANVYDNVISAITALQGDRMFGPYGLFVANTQYLQMLTYIASVTQTALMRVMSIPGMQFVEPADQLDDATAVLFQLTPDVIDLAIAQDITVLEWDEHGGLTAQFKVMGAYAPRPKADADGRSGIAYITSI